MLFFCCCCFPLCFLLCWFGRFLCVCWSCCLFVVVFGRGKCHCLVLHFCLRFFLSCWFFLGQICMLLFLLCCFLHFVCCVVSAGFVFSLLFSLCCGCVWHYICNALVRCPPATFVLFFFVLWPAGFGGVVFALAVPPPVIRPKCGSSVPMRALPCLLPVFPYIKFPHWVHPNHSRTSVSF